METTGLWDRGQLPHSAQAQKASSHGRICSEDKERLLARRLVPISASDKWEAVADSMINLSAEDDASLRAGLVHGL